VVERIGKGGMGVVYRARHREIPRVAALKMMLDGAAAAQSLARFRKDAGSLDQIRHDNIVRLYEYDVDPTHGPYFALELVEGGSLASRVRPGSPWDFRRAARLVETLARAADFAHRNNIVHRDLKPGNVLLAPRPAGEGGEGELEFVPKITDFGLAKTYAVPGGPATVAPEEQPLTCEGAVMGTPSYMAPEQSLGRLDVSHQVDVYALGAILYELLTGRPPFVGGPFDVLAQVQSYTAPPAVRNLRADVPAVLEAICLKCLQRDPAARYATAAGLADALAAWLGAPPTPAPRRTWPARRPVRVALAVLGVALLCGAAYFASDWASHARPKNEAGAGDDQKTAVEDQPEATDDQLKRVAAAQERKAEQAAKDHDRRTAAYAYAVAQEAYRQLADAHPDHPGHRIKLAELINKEGKIYCYLRDWDSAERAAGKALDELKKTPRGSSLTGDTRRDQLLQEAEAYQSLGEIFRNRDAAAGGYQRLKANWEVAQKHYARSRDKRKILDDEFPQDPLIRRDLACSHGSLGDIYLSLGDFALALNEYQDAEEIRKELAAAPRADLDAQMQLARSYASKGRYYRHLGDAEALGYFLSAREHLAKFMAKYTDSPEPPDFILDYACYCNLAAELLIDRPPTEQDQKRGLGFLEEAKMIYEPCKKAHPNDPSLVSDLARTYLLLGKYHLGSDPKAVRDDLAEAENLIRPLRPKGPDDLVNWCLVLALQSRLTEDAREKDGLLTKAGERLQWANDKGYNNLGRLKKDPGFLPLHQARCREYEELVPALEKERKR
jgi:tetratricopeptide (TPR) repeat protein